MKGRLKKHYAFWKSIGCYEFILDTISQGYKIPFYTTPQSVCLHNNRSAMRHKKFVFEAIDNLLIRCLILECYDKPLIVNPLTVSIKSNDKEKVISDLRHVNHHLWKTSVKFEDIRTAMHFIRSNFFCFKFDIHSAYHHIDMYEPHTTHYYKIPWFFVEIWRYNKIF